MNLISKMMGKMNLPDDKKACRIHFMLLFDVFYYYIVSTLFTYKTSTLLIPCIFLTFY